MKQQTSTVAGQLLVELGWEKQACQYPLTSCFVLRLILFSSWENTAPAHWQESVPVGFRIFSTLQNISWIFPYI